MNFPKEYDEKIILGRVATGDDFYSVRKIDAHVHINTDRTDLPEQALANNFSLISINTKLPGLPAIDKQQYLLLKQKSRFPENIYYLTTFDASEISSADDCATQLNYLKDSFKSGAVGVKIWKDIGMVITDARGQYIMPDDGIFDPIFYYLRENNIPVCGHIGEPRNCWLPLDEMTTNNDRAYFRNHPEYHMYLHPDCPSYEALIDGRDRLLKKHPAMRFIGAHLASVEWSFYELSKRLGSFPNMAVDVAERIGQIQYQSMEDWQALHDFFIKYQDRIIYGTDLMAGDEERPADVKKKAQEIWLRDWKYFTSDEELESPFVNGKFRGLKLPRTVIDKFYYQNAVNWYLMK